MFSHSGVVIRTFVWYHAFMSSGTHGLKEMADAWVAIDTPELSDSAVRAQLFELRREIDRLEYAVAKLSATAHQRNLAAEVGASSTPAWLQHQTGQLAGDARRTIQLGLMLQKLPKTAAAFAAGKISSGATRLIIEGLVVEHLDVYQEIEASLVRLATHRFYPELRTAIAEYRLRCANDDGDDPAKNDTLHVSATLNGVAINGFVAGLGGETIIKAIEVAIAPPSEVDTREAKRRRADALVDICRYYLNHGTNSLEQARVPHVNVTIPISALIASTTAKASAGCGAVTEHRIPLSPTDLRLLLCDSAVTRIVTGPQSEPLDVGRAARLATRAIRQAIINRDQCCKFPGCDRGPRWCELHHVIPWEAGGETSTTNMVLLCSYHHHVVHLPGWTNVLSQQHELAITNPQGTAIT